MFSSVANEAFEFRKGRRGGKREGNRPQPEVAAGFQSGKAPEILYASPPPPLSAQHIRFCAGFSRLSSLGFCRFPSPLRQAEKVRDDRHLSASFFPHLPKAAAPVLTQSQKVDRGQHKASARFSRSCGAESPTRISSETDASQAFFSKYISRHDLLLIKAQCAHLAQLETHTEYRKNRRSSVPRCAHQHCLENFHCPGSLGEIADTEYASHVFEVPCTSYVSSLTSNVVD